MFGTVDKPENQRLMDLNWREVATFAPLIALAVWIGIYPTPLLRRLDASVDRVITRVNSVYGPALAKSNCDTPPATVTLPASTPGGSSLNLTGFAACGDDPAKKQDKK
jgi:NADH-quinone oxidoreductase subunit M